MPHDLNITLLRTLVAIGDTSSFSRAADQVNITQSAVSLRIQKLEHLVGKPLIHRARSGVSLTEDGRLLVGYARRMLELNDQAIEHVATRRSRQTIAVGVIEEFQRFLLMDFLTDYHRDFPRVRVDVVVDYTRNLKRLLDEDRITLAILKHDAADPHATVLYRDPLVWVASVALRIDTSRPVPLVVSPEPCVNRAVMEAALDSAGMSWRIVSSSPTLTGVITAVQAGMGVSAIDLRSVTQPMQVLTEADGFPPLPESRIALIRRVVVADRLLDGLVDRIVRFVSQRHSEAPPAALLPHTAQVGTAVQD